jgi:hypothetical protein
MRTRNYNGIQLHMCGMRGARGMRFVCGVSCDTLNVWHYIGIRSRIYYADVWQAH